MDKHATPRKDTLGTQGPDTHTQVRAAFGRKSKSSKVLGPRGTETKDDELDVEFHYHAAFSRSRVVWGEIYIHIIYTYIYTRFPSGTCLGEWRKNELKNIQHDAIGIIRI